MFRRLSVFLSLAVVFSALASIPTPVASAPIMVTLKLTITSVRALEVFEGAGCDDADFFSLVRFGVDPTAHISPVVNDNNNPDPNWEFQTTVDYNALPTNGYFIHIELWEADDTFCGGNDVADINPTPGIDKSVLDFTVDWGRVPCTLSGDVSDVCGTRVTTQGNGDGDGDALIAFRVDLINTLPDADGDGIPDDWETNGVTLNGQFINLPAMGANPNKPDIFLHIDWMQDATHDQRLSTAAIRTVVDAFANSPYVSPTGSSGINLHVDQGPTSILDFATNATWDGLSQARKIAWRENIGTAASGNYDWTEFQNIRAVFFEPTGRSPIFHYVIAAYHQESGNTSSGISRGIEASDLLITLGGFSGLVAGTTQQQAGTLMHELGHNLGLHHGGGEDVNYKPNYLSIMNYLYQLRGLDVGATAGVVDYAGGTLPVLAALNENSLNEDSALGLPGFGVGSQCPDAAAPGDFISQYTVDANGPFDWNCNGKPGAADATTDGIVTYDANGSGAVDGSLTSFDDWAHIKFRVGQIGALGAAETPALTPSEPELPWDHIPPTTTASVAPTPTSYGWNKGSVTVTLNAIDDLGGFGVRDITYSASGAQTIASTTVSGASVSIVIGNEGITTVTYAARDHALNAEATKTLTVRVDRTMPTIALGAAYPAPNAAGWNNTNVNVPFTASDGPSGIAYTVPSASPLVLTAEGTAVTGTVTAYDKADNSLSITSPAFKIDKTPPVITATAPIENQVFDSDQTMTPVFDATDALSGLKSVVGVLDTGQVVTSDTAIDLGLLVGQRTLTVTAIDVADNVATTDVHFRVRPVFVGSAYDDWNESAMREPGERGLANLTVFLDSSGDGKLDPGEASNATGTDGAYRVVGEDVGAARVCSLPVSRNRVRTTARCQTVIVATGLPVPHTDFGSHWRPLWAMKGSMAVVIQSIALAGQPDEYWRPAALQGTAHGPWAGSRLTAKNSFTSQVQLQAGEHVAYGLFIGGVDATKVRNPMVVFQVPWFTRRPLVAITAADGQVATETNRPTTAFAYSMTGNVVTIFGVPEDGFGGYQDVWVVLETPHSWVSPTVYAFMVGTVDVQRGRSMLLLLGATANSNGRISIMHRLGGTRPGALLVDDIPNLGANNHPF